MKATLRSGRRGLVTVELVAKRRRRGARATEERPANERAGPPVLWTGNETLPPPPEGHDANGRNER